MLDIDKLQVHYQTKNGPFEAVKSISMNIKDGEFCTFLGPSGCGKTTTLRCIAGLEEPTKGQISIAGKDVFNNATKINVPTHKRSLGMVFQSYAIWPHMTVFENVAFPLETQKSNKKKIKEEVDRALCMVGLNDFTERSATQLSGGQQQRVALARAIVRKGKILLLDEPLSNLDAKLREQMRNELRDLQQKLQTTTVFVTHDQEEALAMSDRIILMNKGTVVEQGNPFDLYHNPRHLFTARFIGKADVLSCNYVGTESKGLCRVNTQIGDLLAKDPHKLTKSAKYIMIRPESVEILKEKPDENTNYITGTVTKRTFTGQKFEYEFEAKGQKVAAISPSHINIPNGQSVYLKFDPERCVLLEDDPEFE